MGCGSVDVHSMLYPLITLVQCCKPSFIFCFPLYSSHAKKTVQDYETQDKARESFGEKGGKIIHGCLTGSKQPCAIKFVSCHFYFVSSVLERFLLWICDRLAMFILLVVYLKDFYSGSVTGKSGIPAFSCSDIFEGSCGSTKHIISTALLFSLW